MLVIALCAAVAQTFGRFSYGLILPATCDDLGISNSAAGAVPAGIGVGVVSASLFAAALRARRPSPSAMLPYCSPRVLPRI